MNSHAKQAATQPQWTSGIATSRTLARGCSIAIVGAGLAGLELARCLDALDVPDVVVIEAGPCDDTRHNNIAMAPEDALRCWLDPSRDQYFHRPWDSSNPPHYNKASGLRQRIGGRSLYWYGVMLPLDAWVIDGAEWPVRVVADLTKAWDNGPSLYERVSKSLIPLTNKWQPTSPLRGNEPASILGYNLMQTPTAIVESAEGDRWWAYSPLDYWRDPLSGAPRRNFAKDHHSAQIYGRIRAHGVTLQGGRVRGLTVRRHETHHSEFLSAGLVVLAAGTIENSRLALQAIGSSTSHPPRLTGLVDHIVQGFFVRFEGLLAARLLEYLPLGSSYARCPDELRSLLFVDVTALEAGSVLVDVRFSGEQFPSPASYVEAQVSNSEVWAVRAHSVLGASDKETVILQREACQALWDQLCFRMKLPHSLLTFNSFDAPRHTNAVILESASVRSPSVPITWSSALGTEDHEAGTLPAGTLLTDELQFRQIPGLYAVGPSVFPRMGAANPGMTVIALARRLAGHLRAQLEGA